MQSRSIPLAAGLLTALTLSAPVAPAQASSHMDAPLITLDPSANTTDVYAFRSQDEDGKTQYLTTALAVYPFEEPGIGPHNFRFDDRVRYEIHVALDDDVDKGKKTITYRFDFRTRFANRGTILQSYLGVVGASAGAKGFDDNQNMRQRYKVTKFDHRMGRRTVLGRGMVPPNNQGLVTPFYNTNNDGEQPAKAGSTCTWSRSTSRRASSARRNAPASTPPPAAGASASGTAVTTMIAMVAGVAVTMTMTTTTMIVAAASSRLVESVIAASIVVAALNNVWPVVVGRLWMVAFGFGLIHGFGFASVLSDLGLPEGALAVSLLGFNLGVEIGQLAIVAAALPVIYGLRGARPYPRLILPAGSAATAAVATLWLVERSLQVTFF